MRKGIRAGVSGLAACLLLTGCGGGEEPEAQRVTAAQQCDDTLSPEAARALETVLRTDKFDHDPRGGLDRVVAQLTEDYAEGGLRSRSRSLCRADAAGRSDRVDILFGRYDDSDLIGDADPVGLHPYGMGREAWSGPQAAYLFVTCVSPRLEGSRERPARFDGMLRFRRPDLPDTPAVREANLTVLHSVTLALVKKLGCENNAGLPEKPVLKPRPE
ncbi:hypothetical protein KV205_30760 [Streptomyces sp. SKN60]|uniref:hypothetical protein n=1 Tax=Streptomyces sp. SKN60 TaxID=2855506 RepID=UPI00224862A2|nr:hypothetical protein [Streptomyces sp. SKN60]MCX2184877.1 hypothetical protein [Streptomyces sp. SKN60]